MVERRIAGEQWRPEDLARLPRVVQAVLWRRSYRTYAPGTLTPAQVSDLQQVARRVPSLLGRRSGWVDLVFEETARDRVLRAIQGGLVGKTNLWLRRARPAACAVAHGDRARSLRQGARWYYNVDAALAGEAVVLAAADLRLGTCWLAAIAERALCRALDLPPSRRVPAVIPVGHPRSQGGLGLDRTWDRVARRWISGRRKPAAAIHALETWRSTARLPPVQLDTWPGETHADGLSATVRERICDLRPWLEVGGEPPTDAQLAWLVELCRQAPTADNSQIWRMVVLRDPARIRSVLAAAATGRPGLSVAREQQPGAAMLFAGAPFVIRHRSREQPFFLLDVPIGILHVLLGAETFGLSWNLLFLFDHQEAGRAAEFPPDFQVVALLLLGAGRGGRRPPRAEPPPGWEREALPEGHVPEDRVPWIQLWPSADEAP